MWLLWSNYFLFCVFKCRMAAEWSDCSNYLISNLEIASGIRTTHQAVPGVHRDSRAGAHSLRTGLGCCLSLTHCRWEPWGRHWLAWAVDVGSCMPCTRLSVWCAAVVFATLCHSSWSCSCDWWILQHFPLLKLGFEKSVPEWLPKLVRGTQHEADF